MRGRIARRRKSLLCYSVAMSTKHRFPAAALLVFLVATAICLAQAKNPASSTGSSSGAPAAPAATAPGPAPFSAPADSSMAANPPCASGPCDYQPPRISIATPAPAPSPWPLQDRIKWLAVVLLVLIAYVGVWLAVSLLRKIERQTRYAEVAVQAAAEAAQAALALAESQVRAERPWILVTTEPTPGMTNSFSAVAMNRGRSAARVTALAEGTAIAADEFQLPAAPAFKSDPHPPVAPIILLPGESVTLKTFGREEMKSICENAEQMRRVEEWEEKIYFYGNIEYADLVESSGKLHETGWCCWYIHGRQKSGLIMSGPQGYNRHT